MSIYSCRSVHDGTVQQRYSVCNGSALRDFDKVFHPPSGPPLSQQEPATAGESEGRRPQESEITELLSVAASLTRRISNLEKEVATLKAQSSGREALPTQETMDTPLSSDSEGEGLLEEAEGFEPVSSLFRRRERRKQKKKKKETDRSASAAGPFWLSFRTVNSCSQ